MGTNIIKKTGQKLMVEQLFYCLLFALDLGQLCPVANKWFLKIISARQVRPFPVHRQRALAADQGFCNNSLDAKGSSAVAKLPQKHLFCAAFSQHQ